TPSPISTPSCTTTLAPKTTPSPTRAEGLRTRPGASGTAGSLRGRDADPRAGRGMAGSADKLPRVLRAATLGLGMMGRHHARILQSLPGVAFAGAVDPLGDRNDAVRDPAL